MRMTPAVGAGFAAAAGFASVGLSQATAAVAVTRAELLGPTTAMAVNGAPVAVTGAPTAGAGQSPFTLASSILDVVSPAMSTATELPTSLAELVHLRVGALDEQVREVLLVAASISDPTVELISAAVGVSVGRTVELLENSESAGVISVVGNKVRFNHPLLARGVYTDADPQLRRRVHRRLADELGIRATELRMVLPDFSYRASQDGIEENELCPVFVARISGEPEPRPDEVEDVAWWSWSRFRAAADDPASGLSPWARMQAPLLDVLADPLLVGARG